MTATDIKLGDPVAECREQLAKTCVEIQRAHYEFQDRTERYRDLMERDEFDDWLKDEYQYLRARLRPLERMRESLTDALAEVEMFAQPTPMIIEKDNLRGRR